jgi:undecaprenyl diphosphate synthase
MEACHAAGVHILTLYAFSTENWSRPRPEVAALMQLFGDTIDSEVGEMHAEGIQIRAIGDRSKLSPRLQQKVRRAEELTSGNTRAVLNVAINYGGRHEIVAAVRDLASRGVDLSALDTDTLSGALYTAGLPDPDLIVRTAGEMRISNFMLWQAAYAEIYVTETLWPDFDAAAIERALAAYAGRDRRFGAVPEVPARVEEAIVAPASL